jgi:transcription antitermination factor NusG
MEERPNRWATASVFPGYLFVRIDIENPLPVLQTCGVASFVGFGRKPVAVPDNEVEELAVALTKGITVSPHPYVTIGDRVRIKRGPLAGVTGMLMRDKQVFRVVLSVELISKSISVELDTADVELV